MPTDEEDSLFLAEDHEYPTTQHQVDLVSPERSPNHVNVFAGGKSRKARQTLDQAAVDPSKAPKFLNARKRGILGNRSRNVDGVTAPAVRPTNFVVGEQDQVLRHSSQQAIELMPERLESAVKGARSNRHKRDRTVHWCDDDDDGSPVEDDDDHVTSPSPELLQNISTGPDIQTMEKFPFVTTIEIKHQKAEPLAVKFDNVPARILSALAAHLEESRRLHFSHLCCASDPLLLNKEGLVFQDRICGGEITSDANAQLEILAYNLSRMSAAVVTKFGQCCILLYPTGCDAWDSVFLPDKNESTQSWLKYLIFKPSDDLASRLLVEITADVVAPPLADGLSIYHKGLELSLDSRVSPQDRGTYYLIFPNAAGASRMARGISQWLRTCYPRCSIYTNLSNGEWEKPRNAIIGTIIIHESCMEYIHRLTGFGSLLYPNNHRLRVLVLRTPMEALSGLSRANQSLTGHKIALQSKFSHGTMVLLTPSFLFSQPHRAAWFLDTIVDNPSPTQLRGPTKVAVAGRVLSWLLEISTAYTNQKLHGNSGSDTIPWDCAKLRASLYHLLQQRGRLFLAPDNIHPDDEESLVNWFSWWSISKSGMFRYFLIACSDSQHGISMTRELLVPRVHSAIHTRSTRTVSEIEEHLRRIDSICRLTPLGVWWRVIREPSKTGAVDRSCTLGHWLNHVHNTFDASHVSTTSTRRNTYAALFHKEGTEPWLALYRSTPHIKPKKRVELFIFDCGKCNSTDGKSTDYALSDLTDDQRSLIRLIQSHNKHLRPASVLIGSPNAGGRRGGDSMGEILEFLSSISNFEGLKHHLPLFENSFNSRGWRTVKLQDHKVSEMKPAGERRIDRSVEKLEQEFMVFDAPGKSSGPQQSQNRFYRWSQNQKHLTGRFTYMPTRQWYRDQEKNGGGLGHLLFLNWADLASYFNIVEDNHCA